MPYSFTYEKIILIYCLNDLTLCQPVLYLKFKEMRTLYFWIYILHDIFWVSLTYDFIKSYLILMTEKTLILVIYESRIHNIISELTWD